MYLLNGIIVGGAKGSLEQVNLDQVGAGLSLSRNQLSYEAVFGLIIQFVVRVS
jgi:hypothetical protein